MAAANTLGRLARKGWLQRLERGLYLIIPLEAGPERVWSENSYIIGSQLVSPVAIAYWSALRFRNWTEQLPQVVFIQTTKRKKPVVIQGTQYRFIPLSEKHFFGIVNRSIEGMSVFVTDREKTLIDSAARPDLCGGIKQLVQVLKTNAPSINWNKLDQYLVHWGGGAVAKRLGYLVENLNTHVPDVTEKLIRWQKMVTKGISLLEPGLIRKGPVVTRW